MEIKRSAKFKKNYKMFFSSGYRKEKRLKELKDVLTCLITKKKSG